MASGCCIGQRRLKNISIIAKSSTGQCWARDTRVAWILLLLLAKPLANSQSEETDVLMCDFCLSSICSSSSGFSSFPLSRIYMVWVRLKSVSLLLRSRSGLIYQASLICEFYTIGQGQAWAYYPISGLLLKWGEENSLLRLLRGRGGSLVLPSATWQLYRKNSPEQRQKPSRKEPTIQGAKQPWQHGLSL